MVTLATYAYFVACLFGRQYLLPTQYKVEGDKYVPVGFPPLMIHFKMFILLKFRWQSSPLYQTGQARSLQGRQISSDIIMMSEFPTTVLMLIQNIPIKLA